MEQIKEVHQMIKRFVEEVGIDPDKAFNSKTQSWRLKRGSARVDVYILDGKNGRYYLSIYAPLVEVPNGREIEIYEHALKLNFNKLGVKIGLQPTSNILYAISERDINGMDYTELKTCLNDLGWWADKLDDELKTTFHLN